ncbi:hypothetical protein BDF20DRAFT_504191 [Mycotypha africana]|uniref:uncharacterized protein n=1 Tax=Mycotypha africana TaxID=64632 RepID=UPI0023000029|nr:uncharacterized protein BDF20DRAFT_504191 [Mycotypha africana]KAI8979422.1 hypothetical protein BDF20DRAFT_504191 [Mycotypha africana]
MKMAGAAAAGMVGGLALGSFINHEEQQNDRIERLEEENRELQREQNYYNSAPTPAPAPPMDYNNVSGGGYGSYAPPPNDGPDTQTTIIREDGGWFGADKETVITTDQYGDTTIIERKDGWFDDDVKVTNIDADGTTTYEEYDQDNSGFFD